MAERNLGKRQIFRLLILVGSMFYIIFRELNFPHPSIYMWFTAPIAVLLVDLFYVATIGAIQFSFHNFNLLRNLVWAFVVVAYAALLILHFPGFVSGDDIWAMNSLGRGVPISWLSFSYGMIYSAGWLLLGKFFSIALINIVLVSFISFLFIALTLRISNSYHLCISLALLALFLFLPITQSFVLFICRDSLWTLCQAAILLFVFFRLQAQRQSSFSLYQVVLISFVAIFLGDLRQEGKLACAVLLAGFGFYRIYSSRLMKISIFSAFIFGTIFYIFVPVFFEANSYTKTYQLTTFVNPLSEILSKTKLSQEELSVIEAVISVDGLIKDYTPLNIGPFHKKHMKNSFTDEQFAAFKRLNYKLFWTHLDLFLGNRIRMFWSSTNLTRSTESTFIFQDVLLPPLDPITPEDKSMWPAYSLKAEDSLAAQYYGYLQHLTRDTSDASRFFFASMLWPLFLCLGFFVAGSKARNLYSFAAFNFASRLPAIFLLAPGNLFKYYGSVFFGGWCLLVLSVFSLPIGNRDP